MDPNISELGSTAGVVISIVVFLKYLREESNRREETIGKLSKGLDENTKATKELVRTNKEHYTFLKNLNGKLTGAVQKTIKENETTEQ